MVWLQKQEYFEKNKDKINKYRRRKYAENKEQINQKKREYRISAESQKYLSLK
jgi:hypothetical protein